MGFSSICTAIYDYVPQGDGELAINEGELIYVLEKSAGDDWWKAKKRAPEEADDEPVGLIPNNYVEEVSLERFDENRVILALQDELILLRRPQPMLPLVIS